MCYCRSKVNSSHFLTSISGKGDEMQAQCQRCRCRCQIFSQARGSVWGDRLGRIERQLEKTCKRVPPRYPRTSSTLGNLKTKGQGNEGRRITREKDRWTRREQYGGVEECAETPRSTAEELVSRTSCSSCCMATPARSASDRFEPSVTCRVHIYQGVGKVINVNKMVRAGCTAKILIADQMG